MWQVRPLTRQESIHGRNVLSRFVVGGGRGVGLQDVIHTDFVAATALQPKRITCFLRFENQNPDFVNITIRPISYYMRAVSA